MRVRQPLILECLATPDLEGTNQRGHQDGGEGGFHQIAGDERVEPDREELGPNPAIVPSQSRPGTYIRAAARSAASPVLHTLLSQPRSASQPAT